MTKRYSDCEELTWIKGKKSRALCLNDDGEISLDATLRHNSGVWSGPNEESVPLYEQARASHRLLGPMWTNGICGYVSLSLYDPAIGSRNVLKCKAANMAKGLYRCQKSAVLGGILPVSIVSLLWSRWLTPSALYYLTCRYGAVFRHPCSVLRNWQFVNNTHCYIEQAWTWQKLESGRECCSAVRSNDALSERDLRARSWNNIYTISTISPA